MTQKAGIIDLGDYILSITPVKIEKVLFFITTPHGSFIDSTKLYESKFNKKKYMLKFYKQPYWCDLAIFKLNDVEDANDFNIPETRILKSNPSIFKKEMTNEKMKATLHKFDFHSHLDCYGCCKNFYYNGEIKKGRVKPGDSGSGVYIGKDLIGFISHHLIKTNEILVVPALMLLKVLEEDCSAYSNYLPFQFKLIGRDVALAREFDDMPEDFIIKKVNGLNITDGTVYIKEIKDSVPLDTYFHVFLGKFGEIKLEGKSESFTKRMGDLNDYLKYPFISGCSKDDIKDKVIYQNLFEKKLDKITAFKINHNLGL